METSTLFFKLQALKEQSGHHKSQEGCLEGFSEAMQFEPEFHRCLATKQ
jgi:hypothetical protein